MRPLFFSLCFALALGVASSAAAQDNAVGLPDWAAPSAAAPAPSVEAMNAPPQPPSDPPQVPIDGGLGLLALAGGAYAVRKLRQREA